ncbi:MAG: sigma-70 family RNA polymerase sigma factor [Dermatophilaceae bacterium]
MVSDTSAARQDRDSLTPALIERLRAAGESAEARALLERVVRLHMPLARSLAGGYAHRGIDIDDLYQVACLGLLKAVHGFDTTRGKPFSAYAVPTIRGELRRHFRDHSSPVRPPRELQELRLAIAGAHGEITQRLGREATVEDMSLAVGASPEMVRRAQLAASNHRPQSLDTTTTTAAPLAERLADSVDEMDRLEWRVTLRGAVAALDERSRDILRMRFVDDLTQSQIAERLGVSQMHVSRLLARILDRLREGVRPRAS